MKLSMLTARALLTAALFVTAGAVEISAQPSESVQDPRVSMFYDSLKPYGEWVFNSTYGWCWYPNDIDVDWRPYTEGRWLYTDAGWAFDSDAPYGWATFHYGRWFYDDDQGWLWVPDTEWAPCWVVWRYSNTHVGWAPLTPDCVWRDDTGLVMGRYNPDTIPLNYYTFCHMKDFAGADLRDHYLLIAKNATYVRRTRFAEETLRFSNAAIRNELPFHQTLVQVAGHDFQRAHLVTVDSAQNRGVFGAELRVFRPEVTRQNGRVPQYMAAKPAAPIARQPLEPQGLARFQRNRTDVLQKDQSFETRTPPENTTRAQLDKQQQMELQAEQEQQKREQRLLQAQQRPARTTLAPRATVPVFKTVTPPPKPDPEQKPHYTLPQFKSGSMPQPTPAPKSQQQSQNDPRQRDQRQDSSQRNN